MNTLHFFVEYKRSTSGKMKINRNKMNQFDTVERRRRRDDSAMINGSRPRWWRKAGKVLFRNRVFFWEFLGLYKRETKGQSGRRHDEMVAG